MSKKATIIAVVSAAIIIGSLILWGVASNKTVAPSNSDIVYYYGEQCSHCKKVQAFLDENNIAGKVNFIKKEVLSSRDKEAIVEWQKRAKDCGIKEEELGVPFVAANDKCYVGDVQAIDFFKGEAGL